MSWSEHYAVLGVKENATLDEVKQAYKRLAMQLHPDKSNAYDAKEEFQVRRCGTAQEFSSEHVFDVFSQRISNAYHSIAARLNGLDDSQEGEGICYDEVGLCCIVP